ADLEGELLAVALDLVLDAELGGAERHGEAALRDLHAEGLVVLDRVGQPPQELHEPRLRHRLLDVAIRHAQPSFSGDAPSPFAGTACSPVWLTRCGGSEPGLRTLHGSASSS